MTTIIRARRALPMVNAVPTYDPLLDPDIETVWTYGPKLHSLMMSRAQVVKRQDRHEDGSVSTTYYLELDESQYKQLGGE